MKEFSQEYSPIQSKNPPTLHCCEQMLQKIDIKDISNISHHHPSVSQPFSHSNVEQRLTTTAKTLVYLFSPEIDLLQTLENRVEHYDKFQRTKLILKQLVNSIHFRFDRQIDMMKTEEEISKISSEFEYLKNITEVLQKDNHKKSQEIQNLKLSIIKLTKAYEQARLCYQQELLELKFQCEGLRSKLKNQTQKSRSKSRQRKYNDEYSINLKIPKEKKRKESHKYTDRKMYVRFSASQIQQNENVVTSMAKDESQLHNRSQTQNCSHIVILNQLQLEKETLQRKIQILEEELRKTSEDSYKQAHKVRAKCEEIVKQGEVFEKQLKMRDLKIAQKNKIINQLLEIIQNNE